MCPLPLSPYRFQTLTTLLPMSYILGISCLFHDAAAALLVDGQLVAAAQEERFTRVKHTAAFPVESIRYCLAAAGIDLGDLEAVVFYDKPLLKFERLLETYYAFAPRGFASFARAMPVWLDQKLFSTRHIHAHLRQIGSYDPKRLPLLYSQHHLSHAASAFYPSPFERAAILTIDGVGEWSTTTMALGEGREIRPIKELRFPHSVGLLYSAFTYYLGFKVNSGEYKLMGLAPYGDPDAAETAAFGDRIRTHLVRIKPDGSIWMDQAYFNYATGLRMTHDRRWAQLFGLPRRQPSDALTQQHCNLALAIQQVTEEIVLNLCAEARRVTQADALCLAGGVALNCVANGKLLRSRLFDQLYIQPAAGDAGGALGAAWAAWHLWRGAARPQPTGLDPMQGTYLGPAYSDAEVQRMMRRMGAVGTYAPDFGRLCQEVAAHLAAGQVVGWFQGRMEFGPRALGNRSILGDPRNPDMQRRLNLKIKYREGFRPFAPSVLASAAARYFDLTTDSPYMLLVAPVRESLRRPLPPDYHRRPLRDKLYWPRSVVQAITHIDFSARVQTVHPETNPRYAQLIEAFEALTGCPMLVNTSFNVRGEPIVCTPEDAYRCFMATDMDYLVIGHHLFAKAEQPGREDKQAWMGTYAPD